VPALKANALYMDRYPLVSALSRPSSSSTWSRRRGAYDATVGRARLHRQGQRPGALRGRYRRAGAGPARHRSGRDLGMTRDKAIAFAESAGLPIDVSKKSPYSIDQNRLGPRGRDRLPRGHLERPRRGRLRLHRVPGAAARPDEV
jgi:argininosuccinate synthase